jgi:hypothetical protein
MRLLVRDERSPTDPGVRIEDSGGGPFKPKVRIFEAAADQLKEAALANSLSLLV